VVDGEEQLKALCASADYRPAATRGLSLYGPEIMSYLAASLRDDLEVREAFSLFCMALWEGLPRFRWACSFRTWAYTLARHAVVRIGRERGRTRRAVPLVPEMEQLAATLRSATPTYLRTATKRRIAALRSELEPEDRQLLILRVNRALGWDEIARVLSADEDPSPADLARVSAALRKRFERLKALLRERAGRKTG
jgi:RNA polymerase sigma-70 factor (ECF subfamily)